MVENCIFTFCDISRYFEKRFFFLIISDFRHFVWCLTQPYVARLFTAQWFGQYKKRAGQAGYCHLTVCTCIVYGMSLLYKVLALYTCTLDWNIHSRTGFPPRAHLSLLCLQTVLFHCDCWRRGAELFIKSGMPPPFFCYLLSAVH